MLSRKHEYEYFETQEVLWHAKPNLPEKEDAAANAPTRFYGQFTDCMEMYAPAQTVAEYFDAHQEWFCRCSQPMKVEPLGEDSYTLVVGRFGAFGYEVEPKIGLELLPPEQGVYRVKTVPVPDYVAPGYEVDYHSSMELVETSLDSSAQSWNTTGQRPSVITRVEWKLDLVVYVQFPKFIQRLPKSLIQSTGDRLLTQVVRQVSRKLTYKVQEDFHKSLGLAVPDKSKRNKRTAQHEE